MNNPGEGVNPQPLGVILAGGLGRRIGGAKAVVELNGTPLISYPVRAMRAALPDVAVLAKADTQLPSLEGLALWIEADSTHHPLVGLIEALELAQGRSVLVCACDLPFVTPELVGQIAAADPGGAPAVVASSLGTTQPLLGRYQPEASRLLAASRSRGDVPLREAVSSLHPRLFEVPDPDLLFNVNEPEDLLRAAAMLDQRRRSFRYGP